MKTTQSLKLKGTWQLIKAAASNIWKWFTAADENLKLPYHFQNEEASEKQLIEQHEITGTPFKITGNKTKGYWLTMGPYRLTEVKHTKLEVIEELEDNKWNIIARCIQVTHDFEKNKEQYIKQTTK